MARTKLFSKIVWTLIIYILDVMLCWTIFNAISLREKSICVSWQSCNLLQESWNNLKLVRSSNKCCVKNRQQTPCYTYIDFFVLQYCVKNCRYKSFRAGNITFKYRAMQYHIFCIQISIWNDEIPPKMFSISNYEFLLITDLNDTCKVRKQLEKLVKHSTFASWFTRISRVFFTLVSR